MSTGGDRPSARLELGPEQLAWQEDWAETPSPEDAGRGWAHHGLGLLADGRVVAFHPERGDVVIYSSSGKCLASFPTGLVEGHGITVVGGPGDERIWVADPGNKMRRDGAGRYGAVLGPESGQVVQFDLTGAVTLRLDRPVHPAYGTKPYAPTSVVVDEARHGGDGDIWVSDGYGASLVHRFSPGGQHMATIDGREGPGGHFNCPHGIFIDRRRQEPELLVADRGNAVVRVYSLAGEWKRDIGRTFLNSPSAFAAWGERTIVAELRARLAVLGPDESLVGYLGENGEVCDQPGWPNSLDIEGRPVHPQSLSPGKFNSPHGLVTDGSGNVYVAEWLIGGRMIKLEPITN
jgi:hypothetical protein